MGFTSVYRSLTEIFPQIDARMLRAVAIEHPKDADEAASVVLSEILPSLPSLSTHSLNNESSPSVSERQVERGLLASSSSSSSSSSSETIPLVIGSGHGTSAPSTRLVSDRISPPIVGPGVFRKHVESEEQVQSLGKVPDYDFFAKSFDVPILPEDDDLNSVVHAVPQENLKSTRDFWQELGGSHMTWNQTDSITSVGSLNAAQKGSCFEVGTGSTNDQPSKGSLASENGDTESKRSLASVNGDTESKRSLACVNGDTELGSAFSSSTHGCSVDHLEEIIQDAKTNKKTLLAVMDLVMNLMKEVELEEKDAEKSELEAARGGLDTLEKVEEFRKMLKHAKEANDMLQEMETTRWT